MAEKTSEEFGCTCSYKKGAIAFFCGLLTSAVMAETVLWTGGNGAWETPENWDSHAVPRGARRTCALSPRRHPLFPSPRILRRFPRCPLRARVRTSRFPTRRFCAHRVASEMPLPRPIRVAGSRLVGTFPLDARSRYGAMRITVRRCGRIFGTVSLMSSGNFW